MRIVGNRFDKCVEPLCRRGSFKILSRIKWSGLLVTLVLKWVILGESELLTTIERFSTPHGDNSRVHNRHSPQGFVEPESRDKMTSVEKPRANRTFFLLYALFSRLYRYCECTKGPCFSAMIGWGHS